jgi:hypothetical protein
MRRIVVTIDNEGTKVQTSGFKGQECTQEVEKLNRGLASAGFDVRTTDIKYKDEYYAQKQKQQVTA